MSQSICSNSRAKSSEPTASIERNGTIEKATSSSRTPKRASRKSLQGSVALSWGLAQVHRTVKGFPTHIQHQQSACLVKSYCTCNAATMGGCLRSDPLAYRLRTERRLKRRSVFFNFEGAYVREQSSPIPSFLLLLCCLILKLTEQFINYLQ